jgi:hypothetical protein
MSATDEYDNETVTAYVDGELEAARRAEIDAAIAKDAALAARVDVQRKLRARLGQAFAGVEREPVPERLLAAARGPEAAPTQSPRGNVVPFPARGTRAPAQPWRAREWLAMAASLLLGVAISWRWLGAGEPVEMQGGALVASNQLATALDTQLASSQPADADVRIGLSFKARGGDFCRSFTLRGAASAGLACRAGDRWRIEALAKSDDASGELRQAATLPPAVLAAIEASIDGDALDAEAEAAAQGAGWKTTR